MKTLPWIILSMLILFTACNRRQSSLELRTIDDPNSSERAETSSDDFEEEVKEILPIGPEDEITIGVRTDAAPDMYMGEDGELHGFYVDLEKMVMEEMGQAYVLFPYDDVGVAIQLIRSGLMHNALAVPDVPDYRTFLDLSIPYERLNFVTFVRSDNSDIGGSTIEETIQSLHGKRVGVQTRGHIYQFLWEIKEIELLEYATTTQALADLDAGVLDAVPDVERIGLYYAEMEGWDIVPVGEPILSHPVTTGFSKVVDPTLVERYNRALKNLMEDGRYMDLYEGYHGPMGPDDRP